MRERRGERYEERDTCEVGSEVVGEGTSREDGTLGNSGSSIHVRGSSLVLSVPVDGDS